MFMFNRHKKPKISLLLKKTVQPSHKYLYWLLMYNMYRCKSYTYININSSNLCMSSVFPKDYVVVHYKYYNTIYVQTLDN